MKKLFSLFILTFLPLLTNAGAIEAGGIQTESIYGEWWLVGWNDGGVTFEVDTNYVSKRHLSIEIPEDGYVMAYSMVNEIYVGLLTLNGNEMIFEGGGFMTQVLCNVMENLFFEDHICDIKSYQLDGNLLRLYYTDSDYFIFTSDINDSEEYLYEWKNGPAAPYIGEVTAINDEEVEVKIIHRPPITIYYSRTMPPRGGVETCYFAKSDLVGQSFEVGDKVAFRIVQFRMLRVEKDRAYQLKVEPCKGDGHVTDRTGTMHNDSRMGWIIIDDEVNEREGGIYYYPLKMLSESYLIEGKSVTFSGELFPTWKTPWDDKGHSDCYYLSMDAPYEAGDGYRPFVEKGKVWKVGEILSNPVQSVEYYYFDGDTIIDGKTCKQMMCQRYVSPEHPDYEYWAERPSLSYVGAWYEEDRKVYSYDTTNKQFKMMYDFSLDDNDTLVVNRNNEDYLFVIGPRKTGGLKGFKGVYRNITWLDEWGGYYSPTWLEGVGSIDSPTANFYYGYVDPLRSLMLCYVDDEVIYLDDGYEDEATPEAMRARRQRFDFTHTIKVKPKAPKRSGDCKALAADSDASMQSLYGEYNEHLLAINLAPLDDAYLIRITDETGKVAYEKAVNAGSIVGLNIDISNFSKGRYTVSVENNNESYTGEFNVQLTRIETIVSKKEDARRVIYNLHGQRINSLQKGLNIVNGQKIYVK